MASGGVQLTSVRWLSPAAQASTQESHALRGDPTRVPFLEHLLLPWLFGLSWTLGPYPHVSWSVVQNPLPYRRAIERTDLGEGPLAPGHLAGRCLVSRRGTPAEPAACDSSLAPPLWSDAPLTDGRVPSLWSRP